MIKTSEVMVSNVVWSTEFNRPHFIQWGDCGDYEEIPLTREIMEHLGMKKSGMYRKLTALFFNIVEIDGMFFQSHTIKGEEWIAHSINTVHQLQNLLTTNGLPEAAKEVGEKVMELLTANQKQPCRH